MFSYFCYTNIIQQNLIFTTAMWKTIKNFLLDALFPVNCLGCQKPGELICSSCLKQIIVLGLWKINFRHLDKAVVALDYRQPLVRKAVKTLKYSPFNQKILEYLVPFLIELLKFFPKAVNYLKKNNFILVPVPLTRKKLAFRGFNQSELIAQELAGEFDLPLENVLKKIKDTLSQTSLDHQQRKNNVRNAFEVRGKCPLNVVLVDDVLTSGATLNEAAKTLRRAGAKEIWAIVLTQG